ncbi:hypothetical protein CRG98_021040 [Punica granatum]|uniref:Uncharacterized protein n=1 Tax=Punica granatum TaxID=22663 RepID=A0A2I0JQK3_PUNGR|nr:hypothetical protein CRG98_021040 [Punica granatum]
MERLREVGRLSGRNCLVTGRVRVICDTSKDDGAIRLSLSQLLSTRDLMHVWSLRLPLVPFLVVLGALPQSMPCECAFGLADPKVNSYPGSC